MFRCLCLWCTEMGVLFLLPATEIQSNCDYEKHPSIIACVYIYIVLSYFYHKFLYSQYYEDSYQ